MDPITEIFNNIMQRDNNSPGFVTALSDMLLQATKKEATSTADNSNYGLPTPATSTEASPELRMLEASPSSTLCFSPLIQSTDCVDPLLFPIEEYDASMPIFSWDDIDAKPDTSLDMFPPQASADASSNNFCGDCFSSNIFRTKGSSAQIDVCTGCHSTDIIYGTVSMELEEGADVFMNEDETYKDMDKLIEF